MTNPTKRESYISKLVSAARAVITNQIALPLGCVRIRKILYWIGDPEIQYPVFEEYRNDTVDLPLGTERLLCERKAFFRFDKRLEQVNSKYRTQVLEACFNILDRFAPPKSR